MDALILRKLAVRDPDSLLLLKRTYAGDGRAPYAFDYEWLDRFRQLTDTFSGIAAAYVVERADRDAARSVDSGSEDSDPQMRVSAVTGNYFSVLGVAAGVGRALTDDDDRNAGEHAVAVISDAYWRRRFAGSSDITGRFITVNGNRFAIVGVAGRGFSGEWVGRPTDVWIPISMVSQLLPELPVGSSRGGGLGYRLFGRLQPGVSIEQARARGQLIYQQILTESRGGPQATVERLRTIAQARFDLESASTGFSPQRASYGPPLAVLAGMAALVLLLACANVANLLLARSAERQREMSIRLAIGAGRGRLARQLLTESVVLAALGGAAGLLFARWGTQVLAYWIRTGPTSRVADQVTLDVQADVRMLVFAGAVCLLTAVLFGTAPALRAGRGSLSAIMNNRRLTALARIPAGRVLVISQIALAIVLVTCAGTLVLTLRDLKAQDLGVDREHVLLLWAAPRQAGLRGNQVAALYDAARERIQALPDVVSIGVANAGILNGGRDIFGGQRIRVPGYTSPPGEVVRAESELVAPGYFDALGMRLLLGRDVGAHDALGSQPVVVVSESIARRFFNGKNPIGQLIEFQGNDAPFEIVGVVNDAPYHSPHSSNRMMFYRPYRQDAGHLFGMCVAVRTNGDPARLARQAREALRDLAPNLPVLRIDTVDRQLDDVLARERMIASLSVFFGSAAALLASVGLYGLLAYATKRRSNEIGLRLALGATRARVVGMVERECLVLVAVGMAIGVPAAWAVMRAVVAQLPNSQPASPLTVSGAVLTMVSVALLAAFMPAWRASRIDPMRALRSE